MIISTETFFVSVTTLDSLPQAAEPLRKVNFIQMNISFAV
jgi:hypothetical protein